MLKNRSAICGALALGAFLLLPLSSRAQEGGTDGTGGTDATDASDGTDSADGADSSGGTDSTDGTTFIYDTGKDGLAASELANEEGGCAGFTAVGAFLLVSLAWRRRDP